MLRAQKEPIVESLRHIAQSYTHMIVMHNLGMTPAQTDKARVTLRQNQAGLRITKNSLVALALKDTKHDPIISLFSGPTAILYANDIVSLAKVAATFVKEFEEKIAIVGGSMEGQVLDVAAVKTLATLPSIDALRAKLVGLLSAPAQRVVGLVQAPASQLVRVCQAYATT